MKIPAEFIVHETAHWVLNHHLSSALPGYLMLGSRQSVDSLAQLPDAALAEMGGLMARTQAVMERQLQPKWLYISRYGHMPGYPIHFHFIPVYDWVEALFWKDERYRLLQTYAGAGCQSLTDGAELTLFVWREFGEREDPPAVQGRSVGEAIERVREALR